MKKQDKIIVTLCKSLKDAEVELIRNPFCSNMTVEVIREDQNIEVVKGQTPRFALVKVGDCQKKIRLEEIVWIEADGHNSVIWLADKTRITSACSLSEISKRLPMCEYVRIHKSYIVNLSYMTHLVGYDMYVNGKAFRVGRMYYEKLRETLPML